MLAHTSWQRLDGDSGLRGPHISRATSGTWYIEVSGVLFLDVLLLIVANSQEDTIQPPNYIEYHTTKSRNLGCTASDGLTFMISVVVKSQANPTACSTNPS